MRDEKTHNLRCPHTARASSSQANTRGNRGERWGDKGPVFLSISSTDNSAYRYFTQEEDIMAVVVVENIPSQAQMLDAFANFLRIDVANGDASADTVRGYRVQVGQWVQWCQGQGINPATVTTLVVKTYRQAVVLLFSILQLR